MGNFDYEGYYKSRKQPLSDLTEKTGKMKASHLYEFIKNLKKKEDLIIAEIGTGPGDVLNSFRGFGVKIGMDISLVALQSHINKYFKNKVSLEHDKFDFDEYYKHNISRREIKSRLPNRKVPIDGNLILLKIKPNRSFPFEEKAIDYIILCDVVEHVRNPIGFLKDASRIGSNLLIKIPIEKAIFIRLSYLIKGIKYGENHPAGHLHCWSKKEAFALLEQSDIHIREKRYLPWDIEFSNDRGMIKRVIFNLVSFLDRHFSSDNFFSEIFFGGNLLVYGEDRVER